MRIQAWLRGFVYSLRAAALCGSPFQKEGEIIMEFSFPVMALQAQLHRRLMQGLEETGLSTGQPKVLAYLKSHEGQSQKDIARACLLEPGSLTVLLKRMEAQGLIERRLGEGDRKTRRIYLTEAGRTLAGRAVECFYEVESLAFEGVSEEEIAVFSRVCEKMLDNLGR